MFMLLLYLIFSMISQHGFKEVCVGEGMIGREGERVYIYLFLILIFLLTNKLLITGLT